MEAELRNIVNSYQTPQSLGKATSQVCEKLTNSPRKNRL